MPFLTSMPELVMNEILKNLDFRQVQTLRKVCHGLQDFIDHRKPDAKFNAVELYVRDDYILVKYKLCDHKYYVEYRTLSPEDSWTTNRRIVHDPNYVNTLLRDLALILSCQNSTLNNLSLYQRSNVSNSYSNILEGMASILTSRRTPLKTKGLIMDARDQHQMLSIFSRLDSNVLDDIEIRDPVACIHSEKVEMNEVVKSEQWKKAKNVRVSSIRFPYRLDYFEHFSSLSLYVHELENEHVEEIKQREVEHRVGLLDGTDGNKVYFRMKNSSDILKIEQLFDTQIRFVRLSASEAPEGIVVRD